MERMEKNAFSSKGKTFQVSGSFPRRQPRKTRNEVIRSELQESQVRPS